LVKKKNGGETNEEELLMGNEKKGELEGKRLGRRLNRPTRERQERTIGGGSASGEGMGQRSMGVGRFHL